MWAAGLGRTEAIRELLKAGADIEARDNNSETARVFRELMGSAENIGAVGSIGNSGVTSLIWAAIKGRDEAIRELLKAGADIEAKDNDGNTAFDLWKREQKDHPDFQEISGLLRP